MYLFLHDFLYNSPLFHGAAMHRYGPSQFSFLNVQFKYILIIYMYSWDQLYYNILLLVFIRPLLSFYISFRLFGPALAFLSSFRSSLPSSVQGYRSAPLSRSPSPSLSLSSSLTRAQVFVSVVIMWRGSTKPLQAVFLLDVWVRTRSIFSVPLVSLFLAHRSD